MKSLADLEKIRQKTLDQMQVRDTDVSRKIIVGMATCGIAAGARPVMNAFMDQLKARKILDVPVSMTGCIGICMYEPIVDIIDEDGTKTTYVKMTPEKAAKVVAEHIVNNRVCIEYTLDEEKL